MPFSSAIHPDRRPLDWVNNGNLPRLRAPPHDRRVIPGPSVRPSVVSRAFREKEANLLDAQDSLTGKIATT